MHTPPLRLDALQRRDDDKAANEVAHNNLESHIFETKDLMYDDSVVVAVSTAEQREVVLTVLSEAGEWMEDEGYLADTKVCVVYVCGREERDSV